MNFTITVLCSTVLVLLLTPMLQSGYLQVQQSAGCIGTQSGPYQIATATQLDNIRNFTSTHFRQTTDIDLTLSNPSVTGKEVEEALAVEFETSATTVSQVVSNETGEDLPQWVEKGFSKIIRTYSTCLQPLTTRYPGKVVSGWRASTCWQEKQLPVDHEPQQTKNSKSFLKN